MSISRPPVRLARVTPLRFTPTPGTNTALGLLGDDVFVHVHHHVREDAQTLYGFATRDERVCFEALIGAHGVGPSLALAILSVHSPMQLRAALASDDVAALCLVPGVGKKTAARLLVELKSRLDLGDVRPRRQPADGTRICHDGSQAPPLLQLDPSRAVPWARDGVLRSAASPCPRRRGRPFHPTSILAARPQDRRTRDAGASGPSQP